MTEEVLAPARDGYAATVTASPVLRIETPQAAPMPDSATIPELRRPFMASPLMTDFREQLIDDVTNIIQRTPYIEVAPNRMWDAGLVDEFADAVDRLAVKVAKLKEAQGADR